MKSISFTKYPRGSLRQLSSVSIPLILSLLSSYLPNICDRLFLARYSIEALEGCAIAGGLILLFYTFILRIMSIGQVFVAEYVGQNNEEQVGPFIWQMIWLSFILMVILIPLGKGTGSWFFKSSEVKGYAHLYFDYMLYGSCLIGLESALSSFYSGIGKTRVVLYFHLLVHLLNILFNYLFIFGFKGFLPEMGLKGAALGTVLSRGIGVLLFFAHFIYHYWNSRYKVGKIHLRFSLLKEGISKGFPRSLGHVIALLNWNAIAYFMIQKGGNYLLALSYGTSLFFPFFNEGIAQGAMTLAAYLKGAKSTRYLFRLLRSTFVMVAIGFLVMAIPLFIAPGMILDFLMKEKALTLETRNLLMSCSRFVWVMYLSNGIYLVALAFVTAFKETWFYLKMMSFCMFWTFLPIYYAIYQKGASPEVFWIIVSFQPLFPTIILFSMITKRYLYPLYRVSFNDIRDDLI